MNDRKMEVDMASRGTIARSRGAWTHSRPGRRWPEDGMNYF